MIRSNDFNAFHQVSEVVANGGENGATILAQGTLQTDVTCKAIADVRNLTRVNGYIIECTERIQIRPMQATGDYLTSFQNYLGILACTVSIAPLTVPSTTYVELLDYSPKTVNSTISASQNSAIGTSASDTRAETTGSSFSTTNTYDASATLASMSAFNAGASHSDTYTTDHSLTKGSDHGVNEQLGASDSFSTKEWGAYAQLDPTGLTPGWNLTQEYPWDIYDYQQATSSDQTIALPGFVANRLTSAYTAATDPATNQTIQVPLMLAPPSKLAQTGISFVGKARWALMFPAGESTDPTNCIDIDLTADITIASHSIATIAASSVTTIQANVASGPATITPLTVYAGALSSLSLPLLALAPIASSTPAILSFTPATVEALSLSTDWTFGARSLANDLHVSGNGFTLPALDTPLQADVSTGPSPTYTISFKIDNSDRNYTLFIKHWLTPASTQGCFMQLRINGLTDRSFDRRIDAIDQTCGTDNVMRFYLRNLDYSSDAFFDYLQPGLNQIVITLTPSADDPSPKPACTYVLRAISIAVS
jgi:hypothetical protein